MLLNDARFIHPLVEHRRSTKLPRCPSPSTPHVRMCICLTQLRTSNCHYVSHRHGLQEDMLLNDAKYIYPLVEHGWPAKLSRCPSSVARRPMPLHTHIQLVPTIFRPDTAKWRKQGQGLRQHGQCSDPYPACRPMHTRMKCFIHPLPQHKRAAGFQDVLTVCAQI